MDLNILRLTLFSSIEKESIESIQFNGKIINMILPAKVCMNFHTKVLNIFSKI